MSTIERQAAIGHDGNQEVTLLIGSDCGANVTTGMESTANVAKWSTRTFLGLMTEADEFGQTVKATWALPTPTTDAMPIAVDTVIVLAGDENVSSGGIATPLIAAYRYTSSGIDLVHSLYIHDEVYRDLRRSNLRCIDIVAGQTTLTLPMLLTRQERARSSPGRIRSRTVNN
ncbi:hypothetical protein VPH13_13215 [Stenotrophomonas pavanii]|uniref:hypothetical protein n=1 Tax=Stenotrophomonas pavanii TaxID=487698 RepID=UPI002DB68969|nr:hypothetical protein [Stenotrophomonas pavanii]MEC4339677.1 hypothetical protein [Stenotrophomonas pavanii]